VLAIIKYSKAKYVRKCLKKDNRKKRCFDYFIITRHHYMKYITNHVKI